MHRLSGGSFNEEIIELQEWQIFESQKSNSLRHIQMQNRLVAAEEQLATVEEQLVSVTERMMSLELQLNDPIPKNIKGKYLYCKNIFI